MFTAIINQIHRRKQSVSPFPNKTDRWRGLISTFPSRCLLVAIVASMPNLVFVHSYWCFFYSPIFNGFLSIFHGFLSEQMYTYALLYIVITV
uniref:Uncharacterized protein n=1 Tax=Heterorhabditis bacteriophora TaxID=37862 RepID=A0A1I7WQP2_HETBA